MYKKTYTFRYVDKVITVVLKLNAVNECELFFKQFIFKDTPPSSIENVNKWGSRVKSEDSFSLV